MIAQDENEWLQILTWFVTNRLPVLYLTPDELIRFENEIDGKKFPYTLTFIKELNEWKISRLTKLSPHWKPDLSY